MPFSLVSDICPSCRRWNDGDRDVDETGAILFAAAIIEQTRSDIHAAASAIRRGRHAPMCDKTHAEWKCARPLFLRAIELGASLTAETAHPTDIAAAVFELVRPIARQPQKAAA